MSRLFFSINSGRSGSNYLAKLLGTSAEVVSFHEAQPFMSGQYLKMVNNAPMRRSFQQRMKKVHAIQQKRNQIQGKIYCETNHMFIKTFHDVVIHHYGSKVEVVLLRRYLPSVLKSFIELSYLNKNPESRGWMSSPNAKTAAIQCIGPDNSLDHYDICIGYLIDIEARALRFKAQYQNIKVHEAELDALNNKESVQKLFNQLNITFTDRTEKFFGRVVNQRMGPKRKRNNPTTIKYCKRRIRQYIRKANKLGIEIPETLLI